MAMDGKTVKPTTRLGHLLAKALGIKLQEAEPIREDLPGEPDEIFFEKQPTTAEYLYELAPSGQDALEYLTSIFPFLSWIGHYNLQWFLGDLVAGITIGAVVVPQGMAYAKLATLDVQFGLYSSFMGVLMYWLFGTSKDVSIGPVAVLSTITGTAVVDMSKEFPDVPPHVIASGLAVMAGVIVLALGLCRCGWIIDIIPLISLTAFVTGSAITIGCTQFPPILGITSVSTRGSPYRTFINTLQSLPEARGLDSAMGLSALALLYIIRFACRVLANRYPRKQRAIFFVSTLRTVFVILLYTMISWLVNMSHPQDPSFTILRTVPRGFQNTGAPSISPAMAGSYVSYLPATVIVLMLEHIAVAKSFGRVNNYVINPSQEMVAIGITNIMGSFLGGYPNTGSFSRTAIQSKAGSRTPAAGITTALVVLLAIYALPPMFYYVPNASLAAVIIHAVGDLVLSPNSLYQFWRISPIEVLIFFVGVIITVFTNIENGIYATVAISVGILLFRFLKARGSFLGKIPVHSIMGDRIIGDDHRQVLGNYKSFSSSVTSLEPPATLTPVPTRNVFLPIGHGDGSNPEIGVENHYPGIFIYRFIEGFNFPNASHTLQHLVSHILATTRRTGTNHYSTPGDRPWNDATPSPPPPPSTAPLPTLQAVILDFSAVNSVDTTAVQQLVDVRNQLDRHARPGVVDWHMACLHNRWTKRALAAAGFGHPTARPGPDGLHHRWRGVFSVTEIAGAGGGGAAGAGEVREVVDQCAAAGEAAREADLEAQVGRRREGEGEKVGVVVVEEEEKEKGEVAAVVQHVEVPRRRVVVNGLNRPLFHVDLTSALQSAIANAEAAREHQLLTPPSPAV